MQLSVTRLAGPLILIISLLLNGCLVSGKSKEEKERIAKLNIYNRKMKDLDDYRLKTDKKVALLAKKLALTMDPLEKGVYVTKIQYYKKRLKRNQEKADYYKRMIIQIQRGGAYEKVEEEHPVEDAEEDTEAEESSSGH